MTQIVNENYPLDKTSIQELKNSLIQNYNQNEIKKHNFPTEIISLPSKIYDSVRRRHSYDSIIN